MILYLLIISIKNMPKLTKLEPQKQSSYSGCFYWITGFILFFILFVFFDAGDIIYNRVMRLSSGSKFREITGITSPVKVVEVNTLVGFTGDGWDTIVFELTSQQAENFINRIRSEPSWEKVGLDKYFDIQPQGKFRHYPCQHSNIYYLKQIYYEQNKHPSLKVKEDNIVADETYTFCPDDLKLIYNKTYQ